ncbi:MAG: ATP-binding protein, partial [Candidatus Omnitrophica bacterium]|nr:ATP-binding protein [Candidatus Omnitrophota bacterium]
QGQDLAEICRTFAHSTEFHFSGVIDLAINQVNKQACDSLNILHAINLSELAKYGHIDMILCLADNVIAAKVKDMSPEAIIFSGNIANGIYDFLNRKEIALQKIKNSLIQQTTQLIESDKKVQGLYSELEAKNKTLMELDQLKTSFISMVSHELRTPITVIGEGMSLLADKILGGLTPQQERIIKMTRENVERLGRIIAELLDISIIEAGRITLKRDTTDIRFVLKKTVQAFSNKIEKSGVEFEFLVGNEPIMSYADADKMTQVFMNLINNALKFTPEKGKIQIFLENKDGIITFFIKDTGHGIAEKDLPLVFGKFQQFEHDAGSIQKGMGLGLYIVKNIIELHGGRVWVESELGKGSTFYFNIPAFATEGLAINKGIDDKINFQSRVGESEFFTLLMLDIENLEDIFLKIHPDERERVKVLLKNTINESLERQEDVLLGIKDEKFIILLSNTNKHGAKFVCKRLIEKFEKNKDKICDGIDIETRFGFASFPFDGMTSKDLLSAAERSLIRKRNVLLIDDDISVTKKLFEVINKTGRFNCIEINDGKNAMEIIHHQKPDLIISELAMTGMSGYELVGQVRADTEIKDIPIVLMSQYDVAGTAIKSILPGTIPVIKKDDLLKEIMHLVNQVI